MLKVLYSFDNKNNYIKNFIRLVNFISQFMKKFICLIQECAKVLFYYLFKISIFVPNVSLLIT